MENFGWLEQSCEKDWYALYQLLLDGKDKEMMEYVHTLWCKYDQELPRYSRLRVTFCQLAAALSNGLPLVLALVDAFGTECLTQYSTGYDTPMHQMARYQDRNSMLYLHGKLENFDKFLLGWRGSVGNFPIHELAKNPNRCCSGLLWATCKYGPDCLKVKDNFGDTVLHVALKHQPLKIIVAVTKLIGRVYALWEGKDGAKPAHSALYNHDAGVITWVMSHLGVVCLEYTDSFNRKPAYLAHQNSFDDKLFMMRQVLGCDLKDLVGKNVMDDSNDYEPGTIWSTMKTDDQDN